MKKQIGLSLVFALISAWSFGQASVAVGIKAGPNFAKIDVNNSAGENYKNRTGFHGGAFVLIKVGKVGIQPEVLYSKQGSKLSFDYTGIAKGSTDISYDYVNIPVIFKLYTVAGINLQVGPQFGFLSGGQAKSTITNLSTTPTTTSTVTQDAKQLTKSSDFSAALGLGWDLPFGLTIDARYNLGLSKINKSSTSTSTSTSSQTAKNQVFQFSLGYKLFKFGK